MSGDRVVLSAFLNQTFAKSTPSCTFFAGASIALGLHYGVSVLRRGRVLRRIKLFVFQLVRVIAAPIVNKEIAKAVSSFKFKLPTASAAINALPKKGMPFADVLQLTKAFHTEVDEDWEKGGLSGTVYHGGAEWTHFMNRVMEIYQWTNPLHVDSFPAVRKMEAEIVAMVVSMYNGSAEAGQCGSLTTGGTESIMMAIKVYRDFARDVRGITRPNLVFPVTAHPAFDKACEYFNIETVKVPVSGMTGRVDPAELARYINCNTIAIVGSGPNYPYGTVDPIKELSEVAINHGVGLHVDCCLGGFVVPFLEKAGVRDAPVVDFRLPGVTTISCDTHKFGYAPKGTSVVMYRSQQLRRYQYFSVADWPGGLYASPSAPGSKPGNCIAGTWAALMALGEEGYVDATRDIQQTLWKIRDGLQKIPSIYILGNPTVCSVGFSSDEIDIYVVNDRLNQRGWKLNPLQFPSGILFSLTYLHSRLKIADRFVADVDAIVREMLSERAARIAKGEVVEKIGDQGGTLYGGQQRIADRSILADVAKLFFDTYYSTSPPAVKA